MLAAPGLILCMISELPAIPTAGMAAGLVDVELVLAVDVSSSMDQEEFALQRAGYVNALRHPDFIKVVLSGTHRRIALTYFEWAETIREESIIPWQIIDGPDSAADFAARLAVRPLGGLRGTSISGAVTFGSSLFEGNDLEGEKRVIDISGDGPNNFGTPVDTARDEVVSSGIVINGLPILIRPSLSNLDRYYAECVTGGPGSFVLPIHAASEFATAIRHKLILEVGGLTNAPKIVKVQSTKPVDCLVGEHFRLPYPEP